MPLRGGKKGGPAAGEKVPWGCRERESAVLKNREILVLVLLERLVYWQYCSSLTCSFWLYGVTAAENPEKENRAIDLPSVFRSETKRLGREFLRWGDAVAVTAGWRLLRRWWQSGGQGSEEDPRGSQSWARAKRRESSSRTCATWPREHTERPGAFVSAWRGWATTRAFGCVHIVFHLRHRH